MARTFARVNRALVMVSAAIPFGTAAAQVPVNPAPTTTDAPAPAGPAANGAGAEAVGDIVVTAQRRSERLSQVPISITAYNSAGLAKASVVDVRGLTQITPGLNFQSVGSSAQPSLRGIGSSGVSLGDSSNVALYVDGVYQPFQAANFLRFVSLERIEVLKGPQGTLFGRNAAGGAISITTKDPSFTPSGVLGISYSRFEDVQATAYVTGPVVADKLAFNLSADYEHSGGYRRDIYLNRDAGYIRALNLRGKLLFDNDGPVTALLTGYYNRTNDLTTFGNQPLNGDTAVRALVPDILIPTGTNRTANNLIPINRVTSGGASLRITADLGWATLTSLTAFAQNHQFVFTDSDLTPAAYSQSRIRLNDDTVSQDLTLASPGGERLTWLAGATYYRERGDYHIRSFGGLTSFSANPPLISGLDVDRVAIDAYAVFGELTLRLTDRLSIIGGARYSRDEPGFSGTPLVVATGAAGTRVTSSDRFSRVTPRASVRYAITPTVNAYASYSQGFKSGVFNAAALQRGAVSPEKVSAWEAGIKGAPSRAVSFDAAVYHYDYRDLQFQSYGATATQPTLRNAARAEIYGFEANASVMPVVSLTLRAGGAYTHGEYTEFPGAQGFRPTTNAQGVAVGGNTAYVLDASGLPLIRTPRLQLNGSISYDRTLASGAQMSASIAGSRTSTIRYDLAGNFKQKPFEIFNANASYTLPNGHWRGTVFGTNIFNAKPVAGILISALATSVTYQRPATYGAKLEFLF